MKTDRALMSTKLKVGIFTIIGVGILGGLTVYVNDHPYWWRMCDEIRIEIEDATGLKMKSPVRSLGLEIGYLRRVQLLGERVELGICITAPVEVMDTTRAYIRSEGFLGDKFVELKPVKYMGDGTLFEQKREPKKKQKQSHLKSVILDGITAVLDRLIPSGNAQEVASQSAAAESNEGTARTVQVGEKTADMSKLVNTVDKLAVEMTDLTKNLKESLNPEEIRSTIRQLNITLQNASKTLSPEGGLNTTAQRTLVKLEDAIEQFRDVMARINRGEGSIGKIINDPVYAEEIKKALENLNLFLNKAAKIRLVLDLGIHQIPNYNGGRGYFNLAIWPNAGRYYLIGIAIDPRGRLSVTNTTTEGSNGATTTTRITQTEYSRMVLTGILGKLFFNNRLDVGVGVRYGDGTFSTGLRLGPKYAEERIQIRHDFYTRPGPGTGVDNRFTVDVNPYMTLHVSGGVDGLHKISGKIPYFVGGSLVFDDDDFKSLFSLFL